MILHNSVIEIQDVALCAREALEEIRIVADDPVKARAMVGPALEAADHALRLLAKLARSASAVQIDATLDRDYRAKRGCVRMAPRP
jgi:hypothetical protein